jgi:glycosyltransferase involved in cell wall biosynthesis
LSVQRIREGGVDGDATCIFLGSLHNGTDLPFLFRACRLIAKERPDFRLIVGGDGELRSVVEGAAHEYTWLDYRGRLEGQAKIEALAQAQLALHPGHIGLSLVELLAAGCVPVLREVAYRGPEVYYAVPGRNCISLGAAAEEKEYAGVVLNLLRNRAVVGELRREAIESTRAVTIENMATHFATGIALALDVGPRSLVT